MFARHVTKFLSSKAIVAILSMAVFVLTASAGHAAWTIQPAATSPTYRAESGRAMRINPVTNMPHMAFGGDYLYHARFDGTTWHVETADPMSGVGSYAALDIDKQGKQHISYFDETNTELRYATNAYGQWMNLVIDSGSLGPFSAIGAHSDGSVSIVYYDKGNGNIMLATDSSGVWTYEVVESIGTGLLNIYCGIAIDAGNKAHVVYAQAGGMRYATNATSSWVTEYTGAPPSFPTITLDSDGKAHVASYTNYNVWYATNKLNSWAAEVVATNATSAGSEWVLPLLSIRRIRRTSPGISAWMELCTMRPMRPAPGQWQQVASGAGWFKATIRRSPWTQMTRFTLFTTARANMIFSIPPAPRRRETGQHQRETGTHRRSRWRAAWSNLPSIAVDNDSRAYIIHFDGRLFDLLYTTNTQGWTSQIARRTPVMRAIIRRCASVPPDIFMSATAGTTD